LRWNLAEKVFSIAGDVEASEIGWARCRLDLVGGALALDREHHVRMRSCALTLSTTSARHPREEVADGAFDEIGLLEDTGGEGSFLDALLDLSPLFEEQAMSPDEIASAGLAGGAHE